MIPSLETVISHLTSEYPLLVERASEKQCKCLTSSNKQRGTLWTGHLVLCCDPCLLISSLSPTKLEEKVAYLIAILSVGHAGKNWIKILYYHTKCILSSVLLVQLLPNTHTTVLYVICLFIFRELVTPPLGIKMKTLGQKLNLLKHSCWMDRGKEWVRNYNRIKEILWVFLVRECTLSLLPKPSSQSFLSN